MKVEGLYPLREVDTVKVKGKEQATTLYSVVSEGHGEIDEEASEDYKKGLQMYRLGNWSTARDYFEKVRTRYPQDHLSGLYIERCDRFAEEPPDEDWGGAVSLDFK